MRESKTIRLSRHLVALNGPAEIRDTILHEIAHAIAGVANGHNDIWKSVCRRIGATPQRLAGEEVRVVRGKYVIHCPGCERDIGRRYRRIAPKRLAAAYCRTCGPISKGKLRLHAPRDEVH